MYWMVLQRAALTGPQPAQAGDSSLRQEQVAFVFAFTLGRLPIRDHSVNGSEDGRSRPGFILLPGSRLCLIAPTALTPSGEMSAVSQGKCSVPTA